MAMRVFAWPRMKAAAKPETEAPAGRGGKRRRAEDDPAPASGDGETGSSLVEFALSSAVLFTMLFGIMEMCLALYSYHFVSEAAREGSRYAMVRASCSSPCTPTSSAGVQSYLRGLSFPGIASANLTATATFSAYPPGTTCTPLTACTNPGNLVTVTVSYQFPFSAPFLPKQTLTMTSSSAMIVSQ